MTVSPWISGCSEVAATPGPAHFKLSPDAHCQAGRQFTPTRQVRVTDSDLQVIVLGIRALVAAQPESLSDIIGCHRHRPVRPGRKIGLGRSGSMARVARSGAGESLSHLLGVSRQAGRALQASARALSDSDTQAAE